MLIIDRMYSNSTLCESGNATTILQEAFSMKFELANFDIQESYVELNNSGTFERSINFIERTSYPQIIGQTIGFPSSWSVNIKCKDKHARVALKSFEQVLRSGIVNNFAVLKFRINLIDKTGNIIHEKQWQSWTCPRKIRYTEEYAMPDYIELEKLFEMRDFLLPNKTLRLLCDGVIFGDFVHSPVTFNKLQSIFLMSRHDLFEEDHCKDVQLVAETGESFKAHRIVLSNVSALLEGLVLSISNQNEPGLPSVRLDLTKAEVAKMLEYIYTGNISIQDWTNLTELQSLITLAQDYELPGLRTLCFAKIESSMTLNSFPEIVKFFKKNFVEDKLRTSLTLFYLKNQDTLIQCESFQKFAREDKDDFLYVVLYGSSFHG